MGTDLCHKGANLRPPGVLTPPVFSCLGMRVSSLQEMKTIQRSLPSLVTFSTSFSFAYFLFSPSAFLGREESTQSCFKMLFSEHGQRLLCGLVVLNAKQSRRRSAILGSPNYIYFSSILGLELPRRNNVFVEKEGVGGLDVKVRHGFWRN